MSFELKDKRSVIRSCDRILIDEASDVGRTGQFDGRLIERNGTRLEIEVYMKIQFFFRKGDSELFKDKQGDPSWSQAERRSFMKAWHQLIRGTWNRRNAGRIYSGKTYSYSTQTDVAASERAKPVDVTFLFHLKDGGFMWDHFEVDVFKTPKGDLHPPVESHVRSGHFGNTGVLSSAGTKKVDAGQYHQDAYGFYSGYSTAAHEFGHMFGLGDDYNHEWYYDDRKSVMHSGPAVRARHYNVLLSWAARALRNAG